MKKMVMVLGLMMMSSIVFGQVTENFESGTKTSYASATVTLSSGDWLFNDALIGTSGSDRFNGTKSVRLRNGTFEMQFNITGVGNLTIYYGVYGADAVSNWKLQKSTDNGSTWNDVGSEITNSTTTLTSQTFNINEAGAVRFKIVKTTGGTARLNFDDFSTTAFGVDTPPIIASVSKNLTIPENNTNLVVSANVTDNNSVSSVYVRYKINNGVLDSVASSLGVAPSYSGIIPSGLLYTGYYLEYSVSALDNASKYAVSATNKIFVGTAPIATLRVNDENGVNIYNGVTARVSGIASFANGTFGGTALDWFIQDETSGIDIFKLSTAYTSVIGNTYTVIGVLSPFNGRLEIIPASTSDITDNGILGSLPTPASAVIHSISELLTNAEDYEARLVTLQDVHKKSGTWPSTATFSVVYVTDNDVDSVGIYINSTTGGTEPVGSFDIHGVVRQDDLTSPFTEGFQIVPRSTSDIAAGNTLPVELVSFRATKSSNGVALNWSTKTETNNNGFEIEKSSNKSIWTKIGFVAGKGTTTESQSYSFSDRKASGVNYYRLKQLDNDGKFEYSSIEEISVLADKFELIGNYPNPFNPTTNIAFNLPKDSKVRVSVSNILGQEIAVLANRDFKAGNGILVPFNASNFATGMYFYTVNVDGKSFTKSMTLMK